MTEIRMEADFLLTRPEFFKNGHQAVKISVGPKNDFIKQMCEQMPNFLEDTGNPKPTEDTVTTSMKEFYFQRIVMQLDMFLERIARTLVSRNP